jgi:hypothetical protein
MANTTQEQRWAIITKWKEGKTTSAIAKEVQLSEEVVARWVARYKETGSVEDKPRTGHPPALSGSTALKAMDMLLEGDYHGASGVARALHSQGHTRTKVHKSTLIRHAKAAAASRGEPIRATRNPPAKRLAGATKTKRLHFAKANKSRAWAHVMFTDRKMVHFHYPGTQVKAVAWVKKGQRYQAAKVTMHKSSMCMVASPSGEPPSCTWWLVAASTRPRTPIARGRRPGTSRAWSTRTS